MRRRRLLLLGLVVLGVSYLVAGGIIGLPVGNGPGEYETLDRDRLVQPEEEGSYVWPYTSRERSTDGRTLAINVIIHGPDERVQQALVDQSELEWEETDPEEEGAEEETYEVTTEEGTIEWEDAHGSTRYTYFDTEPRGGGAMWVEESYQLHAGTYFGSRHHIRAYTPPNDDWTAIQTHQEYWDWFSLRHTVTDIQDSRNTLEAGFLEQPYVDEVRREYHGVEEGWNDGWLSVIEFAAIGPIVMFGLLGLGGGSAGDTTRTVLRGTRRLLAWMLANVRGFVLAGALAGLFLGVRSAGLVLEAAVSGITPQAFVPVLYPGLVAGLPIVTVVLTQPLEAATRFLRLQRGVSWVGRPLKPQPAFLFTVGGLGTAFVLDFAGLGVTALPLELLLHRLGLLIALGLVAAGATRIDTAGHGLLGVGLLGWIVGIAMPLLGYV